MADKKPNFVFLLCDNTGWGDFSCYGGMTKTPRIDKLASEGIQFLNYSVEAQCTPTRSGIMTGRQSVRSGTYAVPLPGQGKNGIVPWEYTIANLLSDAGYATALFGKWHLGDSDDRLPTEQGFDEWWGYRNSADECGWSSYSTFETLSKELGIQAPQLWEGKKGQKSTAVRPLDMEVRPLLDELITEKATEYIKRAAAGDKPFYTYIALSHFHPPEAVHPDFKQTDPSRLGEYADVIAEMDYRVGQVVDAIEAAGIADDTVLVFSSDNAAGEIPAFGVGGSNGPWRGDFFTPPTEGSMRVPAMVRWPGKVAPNQVSEEPLTCHDWYTTFAALAGVSDKVPTDRPIDGIDASDYLLGKSKTSGRKAVLFFGGDGELMSVKWNTIKLWLRYSEGDDKPYVKPQWPMVFDLGSDPAERYNLFNTKMDMGWMFGICMQFIGQWEASVAKYPNIPVGTESFAGYGQPTKSG